MSLNTLFYVKANAKIGWKFRANKEHFEAGKLNKKDQNNDGLTLFQKFTHKRMICDEIRCPIGARNFTLFKSSTRLFYIPSIPQVERTRGSRPEVFCEKVFLKVSQNSQKKTCVRVSFLVKL